MLSDLINKSKYVRMQKYAALVREINTGHVKTGGKKPFLGVFGWPFGKGPKSAPVSQRPSINSNGKLLYCGSKPQDSGSFKHNDTTIYYKQDKNGVKFFSDEQHKNALKPGDSTALEQELKDTFLKDVVLRASRQGTYTGYRQGHARGTTRGALGTAGALGTGYLGLSYLGRDKEYTPNTPGTGGGTKEESKDSLLPWLIGVPLVAGASYGAYKLLSKKKKKDEDDSSED